MAAKTLGKFITPIAVRLRSRVSRDYKRANTLGFLSASFDSTSTPVHPNNSSRSSFNVTLTQDSQADNVTVVPDSQPDVSMCKSPRVLSQDSITFEESQQTPSSSHPLGDEASIETSLSLLTPLNAQRYTNGDSSITLSSQVTVSPQSLSRTVADSEQSVTDVGNSSIELDESSTDIVTNSDNPEPDSVKVTNSVNPEPDSVSDNTLCNLNLVQQPEVRCTSGTDTKLALPDATLGDSTLCGLCPEGPPGSEDSESKQPMCSHTTAPPLTAIPTASCCNMPYWSTCPRDHWRADSYAGCPAGICGWHYPQNGK